MVAKIIKNLVNIYREIVLTHNVMVGFISVRVFNFSFL